MLTLTGINDFGNAWQQAPSQVPFGTLEADGASGSPPPAVLTPGQPTTSPYPGASTGQVPPQVPFRELSTPAPGTTIQPSGPSWADPWI